MNEEPDEEAGQTVDEREIAVREVHDATSLVSMLTGISGASLAGLSFWWLSRHPGDGEFVAGALVLAVYFIVSGVALFQTQRWFTLGNPNAASRARLALQFAMPGLFLLGLAGFALTLLFLAGVIFGSSIPAGYVVAGIVGIGLTYVSYRGAVAIAELLTSDRVDQHLWHGVERSLGPEAEVLEDAALGDEVVFASSDDTSEEVQSSASEELQEDTKANIDA